MSTIKADTLDTNLSSTLNVAKPVNVVGSATADTVKTDILDTKNDTKIVSNKPIAVDIIQSKVGGNVTFSNKVSIPAGSAAGEAVNFDQVIGVGQTWQDVTASRAVGVTYTNTNGKPIQISVISSSAAWGVVINGVTLVPGSTYTNAIWVNLVIPNGATYSLINGTIGRWLELR